MVRNAIVKTLRDNPEGLTASEILDNIDNKHMRRVRDAKHISNLVKGMKNIKKMQMAARAYSEVNAYKVNVYLYDDEGAEI
jgi:hypothetical protein